MVFLPVDFAKQRFVFQNAVDECAGWVHAAIGPEENAREDAECLGISFETAVGLHEPVQSAFAGVAERRMSDVVSETGCLDEIGIDVVVVAEQGGGGVKPVANASTDLSDFDGVGQAGAVEVVFATEKDLCFVLQSPESGSVDDTVAINLERRTIVARNGLSRADDPFVVKAVVERVFHQVMLIFTPNAARRKNSFDFSPTERGVTF